MSPEYGARLKSPQMFVQDDFKVRPNLTVNLGLRYQINHGWNEVHGNIASFDPTVTNPADDTLGAYWFGETHANGRTALEANVYNTFLPRIGASWAVRPNMTVRGGFGLYAYNWSLDTYGHGMGNSVSSSGSFTDPTNGIYPAALLGGNGNQILSSSYYNGPPQDSGTPLPYTAASQNADRFNGGGADYQLYHAKVPKIYQWNGSVQRQLTSSFMAEVAYVGSHAFNLAFPVDLNQVPQADWAPVDSQFRPYANFQGISGGGNAGTMNGISNYNSLQLSITKRVSYGLSLNFNYVWSHFLDDLDSSGWGSRAGPQDYQDATNPSGKLQQLQLRRPARLQGLCCLPTAFRQRQALPEQQHAAGRNRRRMADVRYRGSPDRQSFHRLRGSGELVFGRHHFSRPDSRGQLESVQPGHQRLVQRRCVH